MKRTLTGIVAAGIALGTMAPTAFHTAGCLNSPMTYTYRGGNRQSFKNVANRRKRGKRR